MERMVLMILAVAACSIPDKSLVVDEDAAASSDAAVDAAVDGDVADAPLQTVTLSQNVDPETIVVGLMIGCATSELVMTEISFYRSFAIIEDLRVTGVQLGVDDARAPGGSQTIKVRLHRQEGSLALANLTLLRTQDVSVADQTGALLAVALEEPLDVEAGSVLAVEILVPDRRWEGGSARNYFYAGANSAGEAAPGYLRMPDCSTPEPAPFSSFTPKSGPIHLVLNLVGLR